MTHNDVFNQKGQLGVKSILLLVIARNLLSERCVVLKYTTKIQTGFYFYLFIYFVQLNHERYGNYINMKGTLQGNNKKANRK